VFAPWIHLSCKGSEAVAERQRKVDGFMANAPLPQGFEESLAEAGYRGIGWWKKSCDHQLICSLSHCLHGLVTGILPSTVGYGGMVNVRHRKQLVAICLMSEVRRVFKRNGIGIFTKNFRYLCKNGGTYPYKLYVRLMKGKIHPQNSLISRFRKPSILGTWISWWCIEGWWKSVKRCEVLRLTWKKTHSRGPKTSR